MNRKKNVTGTANSGSMDLHGQGRQEGPVGAQDGYQARKEQQASPAQRVGTDQANRPMARPKSQPGQTTGSMNTQGTGFGAARPQQSRPQAQQARPQQSSSSQRPLYTQQSAQQSSAGRASSTGSNNRSFNPLILIVVAAVLLLGGGGGLSGLFGGDGGGTVDLTTAQPAAAVATARPTAYVTAKPTAYVTARPTSAPASSQNTTESSLLEALLGGSWYSGQTGLGAFSSSANTAASQASAITSPSNGKLDRSVASGSRNKYTTLLGNGKETVTIMVYMCGADLESKSAMGTKDLQEMLNATYGDNVRVIVFTGGASSWRNNLISSSVNQIWQVKSGQMVCLRENAGTAAMTSPDNLSSFIQFCAKNFPASRYALILWDHGSGSVSGYGYDEKNSRSGSMSLAGLNTAFQNGGVKFDFIGFDACLMATVETALMAGSYADYLIASEETEPGIGWYYTNWLTALGKNTSLSTLDIGQKICDDFVSTCASQCKGQKTTLSVIDLAELAHTVPEQMKAFSQSITSLISNQEYKTVSNARNGSREFAASSRIDQVDLTDLCNNLGTKESAALARALTGAVKYNRINNISNAYGLSVYFPYQKVSNVDKAVSTYAAIGMDSSYADAIRAFASVEAGGQAVSGGTTSAIPSLFGSGSYSSSSSSDDLIGELLSAFLGGGFGRIAGLDADNTGFLSGSAMTSGQTAQYLAENMLDASQLAFQKDGESWVLSLSAEQWALVHGADLNLFYDNGAGYVDLGLDNLFEFDGQGRMVADVSGTWLAINGQPVAYYHEVSEQISDTEWSITGRVPALLNGSRVDLLIVFDQDHESGFVAGARAVYVNGETDTVAKAIDELQEGDEIVFLADLYDYNQNFVDSYHLGDPVTVSGELMVSDVYLPDPAKALASYRFTDIYNQAYWTPVIGR